jgi:hypothetical protein
MAFDVVAVAISGACGERVHSDFAVDARGPHERELVQWTEQHVNPAGHQILH